MDYTHLLIRYGELFLKGKNRPWFEQVLLHNINTLTPFTSVKRLQGRLLAPYNANHKPLKNVFGLVSYSPCIKVDKTLEQLQHCAHLLMKEKIGTFRVETRRSDKRFPLPSPEVNRIVGRFLENSNPQLEFSLSNPKRVLFIELHQEGAFLFTEVFPCFGGLPTGVEGKALLVLENEASILAGVCVMKRGVQVIPIGFKHQDLSLLQHFSPLPLKATIISTLQEIEAVASFHKVSVLIAGGLFKAVPNHLINPSFATVSSIFPVLYPLVAYTPGQVQEELQYYS